MNYEKCFQLNRRLSRLSHDIAVADNNVRQSYNQKNSIDIFLQSNELELTTVKVLTYLRDVQRHRLKRLRNEYWRCMCMHRDCYYELMALEDHECPQPHSVVDVPQVSKQQDEEDKKIKR